MICNTTGEIKIINGFTLVEILVTIIVAALVGVVIFTYLSEVVVRSTEPVIMARNLTEAVLVMEKVTMEYSQYLNQGGSFGCTRFENISNMISCISVTSQENLGDEFEILKITVSSGKQSIAALFSE
ncbi:MAG: prepilin-type N-terminal cleavage/methylation domain-containing protein [Desulfonatronovibrio sp. MSAO_Bac4]|nr:MAG: prepilin-type N-terminal cleavage/methylation domain-containing protein [Desulfonatronovibrio sp. MSAO_Bac4]